MRSALIVAMAGSFDRADDCGHDKEETRLDKLQVLQLTRRDDGPVFAYIYCSGAQRRSRYATKILDAGLDWQPKPTSRQ